MKAVVYEAFSTPPQLQTVPDPTPETHGVVVKVEATGVCRSDWHGWVGHDTDIVLPHVPGHEAGQAHEQRHGALPVCSPCQQRMVNSDVKKQRAQQRVRNQRQRIFSVLKQDQRAGQEQQARDAGGGF